MIDQFLQLVWGKKSGYAFLPRKDERWREIASLHWPCDIPEPDLEADSYFCPLLFSKPRRVKENALPTPWLYADLDAVDPRRLSLRPTVAWQTSPGRYQALWRLKRTPPLQKHQDLNRRLTYATGADKGGWHLTKVLRLPYTYNHKYEGRRHKVKLLWDDGPAYGIAEIEDYVKDVEAHEVVEEVHGLVLPAEDRSTILKRAWTNLDARSKELLQYKEGEVHVGERSDRLWELECRLLEAGLDPEEAFVVLRDTPWNKFKERDRGDEQLWKEVGKAHLHVRSARHTDESGGSMRLRPRVVTYAELLGTVGNEPEWLVEDWWTLGSHGIIAGLPKSYKSLVSLDLAVSVASESPFLGNFEVNPKGVGPVLIVQQENSLPLLRDRLIKISTSRGLSSGYAETEDSQTVVVEFPPALPIHFYNDFSFDMTLPDDREAVEDIIRTEGIKMVVFDPLYLMIGGADENQAKEMRPILSWLLQIRNRYNTAVVVVHHWGKGGVDKKGRGVGGLKLLGSTTIYGWIEAALYLEAQHGSGATQVVVEREFRERLSPPPSGFTLTMGDVGDSTYEWATSGPVGSENRLVYIVGETGAEGASYDLIQMKLGIGRKKAVSMVTALVETNELVEKQVGRQKRFFLGDST